MIIGITGNRYHGKSEIIKIMQRLYGYQTGHAFAAGKAMSKAYFMYCGATEEDAEAMINGHLKDEPSPYLPHVGPFSQCQTQGTPRFFMETLGNLMPTYMGVAWTSGVVIDRVLSGMDLSERAVEKQPRVVFDSIVYEDKLFHSYKIPLVKVYNPNPKKYIQGLMTDDYVAALDTDYVILNDGNLGDLEDKVVHLMTKLGITQIGAPNER